MTGIKRSGIDRAGAYTSLDTLREVRALLRHWYRYAAERECTCIDRERVDEYLCAWGVLCGLVLELS